MSRRKLKRHHTQLEAWRINEQFKNNERRKIREYNKPKLPDATVLMCHGIDEMVTVKKTGAVGPTGSVLSAAVADSLDPIHEDENLDEGDDVENND